MCGPCAEPGEDCTPQPERIIGYARCACGGECVVKQRGSGYIYTEKCSECKP